MSHPHEHEDRELVAGMQKGMSTVTSIASQLVAALQRRMQLAEQRRRAELAAQRADQKPLVHRDLGSGDLAARWAAAHAVATAARAEADAARDAAAAAREDHGETHDEYRAAAADAAHMESAATTAEMWAGAWDDRAQEAGIDAEATNGALAEVRGAQSGIDDQVPGAGAQGELGRAAAHAAGEYAQEWQSSLTYEDQSPRPVGELLADTRLDPNASATAPGQWAGDTAPSAAPLLELASSTSAGAEL